MFRAIGEKIRESRLDFSDRRPNSFIPLSPLKNSFSKADASGNFRRPLLERNKSERHRLQGLMRKDSSMSTKSQQQSAFSKWMVNEGPRRIFFALWILVHALCFAFGFVNYQMTDKYTEARALLHITFPIAKSAAFCLHLEAAFLLLPICRNFITLVRRTPLGSVIPFDSNITFHKAVGWSLCFFTVIHVTAHMFNFAHVAKASGKGFVGFLEVNFTTGPGVTGWIMLLCLGTIAWFAVEKRRRSNFERFWYSHHLFIIFFCLWQLHEMFCFIKPDHPPYCSSRTNGVFWKWWIVGGAIFTYERILREVRSRHNTYISKVIQHPSNVVEVQIKKEKTITRAGQYCFINVPEISYFQWHPFTLTSAPEEDYISFHIRMVGDFTKAFGKALGCDLEAKSEKRDQGSGERVINPPLHMTLPRVMVDGPFGSASEDFHKFEVVILVGAGIGVTPFASILKSIWYRANFSQGGRKTTRLQKVYFFQICRDMDSMAWFRSLLLAIESQDLDNFIEIHCYLTQKMKEDELHNIVVQDVGSNRDAITGLRAPTHYGRPNWDKIFSNVRDKHPGTEVGVMFCGPKALGSSLHSMCNKYSTGGEDDTRFIWGKENF